MLIQDFFTLVSPTLLDLIATSFVFNLLRTGTAQLNPGDSQTRWQHFTLCPSLGFSKFQIQCNKRSWLAHLDWTLKSSTVLDMIFGS
ncbi:uncharacterized protein LOC131072452 [Cryptomeria japonica]|uniref:uncharacterized protein LOC131072452 n=1 Tax=Cryptomeria japonica TaxID=3369 RepID=UPI0027D9F6DB|nr:uncharacterized protein LOC131072452 [Cryptomeria japonica]